ncbi:MAG: TerB family tellurite resistance protein [Cyclobacteriaceae bacterium]
MANIILLQALAELSYSIAMADGELEPSEKKAFFEILDSELNEDAWSAKNRFKLLEESVAPSIEQSYKFAMFAIKTNKDYFDNGLKTKFVNVIERVACAVDGLRSEEKKLIERFKTDINSL